MPKKGPKPVQRITSNIPSAATGMSEAEMNSPWMKSYKELRDYGFKPSNARRIATEEQKEGYLWGMVPTGLSQIPGAEDIARGYSALAGQSDKYSPLGGAKKLAEGTAKGLAANIVGLGAGVGVSKLLGKGLRKISPILFRSTSQGGQAADEAAANSRLLDEVKGIMNSEWQKFSDEAGDVVEWTPEQTENIMRPFRESGSLEEVNPTGRGWHPSMGRGSRVSPSGENRFDEPIEDTAAEMLEEMLSGNTMIDPKTGKKITLKAFYAQLERSPELQQMTGSFFGRRNRLDYVTPAQMRDKDVKMLTESWQRAQKRWEEVGEAQAWEDWLQSTEQDLGEIIPADSPEGLQRQAPELYKQWKKFLKKAQPKSLEQALKRVGSADNPKYRAEADAINDKIYEYTAGRPDLYNLKFDISSPVRATEEKIIRDTEWNDIIFKPGDGEKFTIGVNEEVGPGRFLSRPGGLDPTTEQWLKRYEEISMEAHTANEASLDPDLDSFRPNFDPPEWQHYAADFQEKLRRLGIPRQLAQEAALKKQRSARDEIIRELLEIRNRLRNPGAPTRYNLPPRS